MDFGKIRNANGLEPDDAACLDELLRVHSSRLASNQTRLRYYRDEVPLERIGYSIPETAPQPDIHLGWAAKAVDMLSARSILDGFTAAEGTEDELRAIVRENRVSSKYDKAVVSELVSGCGFWTVMADDSSRCGVRIMFHNALNGAAVWDVLRERVRYGFVIEDWGHRTESRSSAVVPTQVAVHFPDHVLRLVRSRDAWECSKEQNPAGEPLMVSMQYRPDDDHPLGRSRISRAVMSIIQQALRERERTEYHSEFSATGSKYILGAADELFDVPAFNLGAKSMLLVGRDENGDIPTVGQFAQQSVDGHVRLLEKYAADMASETCIPVSSFGIMGNGYTSSDALRASNDDLIVEAESLNKTNGESLVRVATLALAVSRRKSVREVAGDADTITVKFRDPSIPSAATATDAVVKQASILGEQFAKSDVCLEKLGYNEDERTRIKRDMRSDAALAVRDMVMAANGGAR